MGQFAAVAMVLGAALQAQGTQQAGEAEKQANDFNARAALDDSNAAADRTRVIGRRIASLNVTRVAKSGVEMQGSPLELLAANAGEVELEALRQQRAGKIAAELYRATGRNALTAANTAAISQLIGGAAQGIYSFGGGVSRQGIAGGFGATGSQSLGTGGLRAPNLNWNPYSAARP